MKRSIIFLVLAIAAAAIAVRVLTRDDGGRRASGGRVAVAAEPLRRVVFVGVDGADWEIIQPLVDAGRLPHFATLVRDGASGPLRSLEPALSPLLWTTIATGKLPEEHGILSFTAYDPKTGKKGPITRRHRKVDAFWNMLSDHGRTVDVVGWLATYPAEDINGVMATDRLGYLAYAAAGATARGVLPGHLSPPARTEELAAKLVPVAAVQYDDFERFVNIDEATFRKARSPSFDPENPIRNMILLYASTLGYRDIALHLLREDRPDFLAVYFELVDAACHLFMHYAPPRGPEVDEAKYDQFKNAVEEAYILQDEILGELMESAGDAVIIVASDHGFRSGPLRPKHSPEILAGEAAFWHRLEGVLCLYGDGIRKGHRIEDAALLDVAPTILALQGLPKPADMPGRILVRALDDSLAMRLNSTHVATLQRARQEVTTDAEDPAAEAALRKLEALGYITAESPDAHNNLGQRYQKQRQFTKAIVEFEKALALRPDFPGALNNLGACYLELGRFQEAEAALLKALALKPDDIYAMNNIAIMYAKRGDLQKAREYAERAVAVEPNYAKGHLSLGNVYGTLGRFDEAEREFLKVLEIDPANQTAKSNLEKLRAAREAGL
jgi:Flp pilus assembly protein TadD